MDYALTVNDAGKDRWARDKVKNEKIFRRIHKAGRDINPLAHGSLQPPLPHCPRSDWTNGGNAFLFSVVFTPSLPPRHHGSVWIQTCHLSTFLN